MKIVAQRESLLEGLVQTSNIASVRTPKPILQDVRLETKEDYVELSATDLEIGVRIKVEGVEVKEKGAAALPAARLAGIVKLMISETVQIETEKESAVVKGGKSTFNVLGDNADDFPDIPSFADSAYMAVTKEDFRRIVRRVSPAAASESTRYALNGVLFSLGKGKLTAVAADGKRLARLGCKVKGDLKLSENVIVPTRALSQFANLVPEDEDEIRVSIDERGCILKAKSSELFARLVEGHYPPYEDAIPKDFTKRAEIDRGGFENAMMQAAVMTTEESRAVKLLFSRGGLKMTSFSAHAGRAEVEMDVAYEGEDLEVAFNPSFILDYLKGAPEEKVVLRMIDKEKPAMFEDGPDFIYIVMPVSVG